VLANLIWNKRTSVVNIPEAFYVANLIKK